MVEQQGSYGKLLEYRFWTIFEFLGGWGWLIMLNCYAVARFVSLCSHILGSNTRLLETNMGRVELKIFPKIPGLKTYGNVFFKSFE